MRLVVDASTLVAELLRTRGRARLREPRLELFIAEPTWSETRHELLRRERLLVQTGRLTPQKAAALVQEGFQVADITLTIIPNDSIEPLQTEALWRIPQDPDDWPSVALALALDAGIWSEDRDFFGCGLATWTTPVLDHYLTTESA